MFTRYAEQYGGNNASAHVLMEAELEGWIVELDWLRLLIAAVCATSSLN